jgi:hypothetical protein
MAQKLPRNHKIDPQTLETASRRISKRVLELMMAGLRDDELYHAYNSLRDALVGIPDYSYKPPKKKTSTPNEVKVSKVKGA